MGLRRPEGTSHSPDGARPEGARGRLDSRGPELRHSSAGGLAEGHPGWGDGRLSWTTRSQAVPISGQAHPTVHHVARRGRSYQEHVTSELAVRLRPVTRRLLTELLVVHSSQCPPHHIPVS